MTNIKINILDYLGKINDGVLTLISINHQGEYYEGTFFYNKKNMLALTVDIEMEEKLGCPIEEWSEYSKTMLDLIKKVVPIEEIITRLDEIDINKYQQLNQEDTIYIESGSIDMFNATQSTNF